MAAAGRVLTGFSRPWVALYSATGTTVSYTSGQRLARGVSVTLEPNDAGESNDFYADNALAESEGNVFSGATCTLTVDGLHDAAEKLVMGLPEAGTDGGYDYDDDQVIPYVGIGYIERYMSDGVTTYRPVVLYKAKFNQMSDSAATQEEQIDWQTQELTANVMRSDAAKGPWRYHGSEQTTEDAAEEIIKTKLGVTA